MGEHMVELHNDFKPSVLVNPRQIMQISWEGGGCAGPWAGQQL